MASNHDLYDPEAVLQSPDFKVLKSTDEIKPEDNVACFYNPAHESVLISPFNTEILHVNVRFAVHLVRKPIPHAGPGQVVIKVRATGICGSDVHFWKDGRIGTLVLTDENGSGHESAGEIIEIGENVTKVKVGDRVAIEAGIPCGACEFCLKGRYNACPTVVFFSTPPYHGTLTRFHLHPAAFVHKIPDHMSFEEGALCEPLAVALAGLERANLKLGDPLLICGAGPIGLVTLLAARAAGATPIVVTDLSESRLNFTRELVPNAITVLINRDLSPKEQAKKVKEAAGMDLALAIECSGVESSVQTAIFSVKSGSTVFVIGNGKDTMNLPFMHASFNEIDIKFLYRYANQYPKAIRLISGGLVNLKPLVTHRYPIEEAVKAFHTAADISAGAIKVQIVS